MVFGATTFRQHVEMLGSAANEEFGVADPWVDRMRSMPMIVVSSTATSPTIDAALTTMESSVRAVPEDACPA